MTDKVAVTQEDLRAAEAIAEIDWPGNHAAYAAAVAEVIATTRIATAEACARDMPTIWEDPAGKGYPCFERAMTPAEAKATIAGYGARLAACEDAFEECAKVADRAASSMRVQGAMCSDREFAGAVACAEEIAAEIRATAIRLQQGSEKP